MAPPPPPPAVPLPRTPPKPPAEEPTPKSGMSASFSGGKAERGEAEVAWLRRVLNTEDPAAAPEPGSKEFNRVREEAARRTPGGGLKKGPGPELMHLAASQPRRGDRSPEDPNPEPFDQGIAEQAAVSASLADACTYNDGLWAGVPRTCWDPSRQRGCPSAVCQGTCQAYTPGLLGGVIRGTRAAWLGAALPGVPEARPSHRRQKGDCLEEIVVDEVP